VRRIGNLWDEVTSFANLCRAAKRAAAGKRWQRGVASFLERLEPNALALQRELRLCRWRPAVPATFAIHDPKERIITAAPFADRVVHHALIDVLEPHLDRSMVEHSFACRQGKGQHRAMLAAQRLLRTLPWFLQLDVARFFPSLRHDVVLDALARRIKDRAVLALCRTLVEHGGGNGVGVPIGNLWSQWFANLVLDRLDHWLVEELRVGGYVRYMDDFVVFGGCPEELARTRERIEAWLGERGLAIKSRAARLWPKRAGLPFLGFQLFSRMARLLPANARRTRARLRRREWQCRTGVIDEERLAASAASSIAHLQHGATLQLRRAWFTDRTRPRVVGPGNRCNCDGNFDNDPDNAQSGNRNDNDATDRNENLGLRAAKTSARLIPMVATVAPPGRCLVMSRSAAGPAMGQPKQSAAPAP